MEKTCPICNGSNFQKVFSHQKWLGDCFCCLNCTHIHYFNYNNPIDQSDFATGIERANYYLNLLKDFRYNSIADIGAPKDLYFLEEIHKSHPSVRKLAFDMFAYEAPSYIETTNTLEGISVDLAIALHVLEHIIEPLPFLKKIIEISRHFIIEIPDTTILKLAKNSTINPHYHCFTRQSFNYLLDLCKVDYKLCYRKHKRKYPVMSAHNLPMDL